MKLRSLLSRLKSSTDYNSISPIFHRFILPRHRTDIALSKVSCGFFPSSTEEISCIARRRGPFRCSLGLLLLVLVSPTFPSLLSRQQASLFMVVAIVSAQVRPKRYPALAAAEVCGILDSYGFQLLDSQLQPFSLAVAYNRSFSISW